MVAIKACESYIQYNPLLLYCPGGYNSNQSEKNYKHISVSGAFFIKLRIQNSTKSKTQWDQIKHSEISNLKKGL